ncbi:mitochondrial carrier [Metschnikowia bicuspidata var. bicuspidata NRRL YB-4993]|uniref:Mitochondrial carrier n=1 Tax=Metschnikowia bicuspidata var. bicuspidata NRRL YB-4993 TaxID=869754 RepID=A0A1A0HDD8_9ASCO|nr:mitochondrial carrier [Metschnikowia bicuspidata var. bicuspidata NRRL YB-4993]OBA22031.1 mitochondrial carrier [Metschnikowia bicuspidata var. bicuspidata NRRL YB-4993]
MSRPQNASIPAITGNIDELVAIRVFPASISPYRLTIIAYGTSFVATVIGFPFDTVKTRMQLYKKFTSMFDCVRQSYMQDGVRGFYRGIWAPLFLTAFVRSVSVSIFTGAKPLCYDLLYGWNGAAEMAQKHPFVLNFPVCFFAGAAAGVGTSLLSCPFEFTKVYSQIASLAQKSAPSAKPAAYVKHSTLDTVRAICRQNGPLGLYSGYRYQVIRDASGSGIYFATYEAFKWTCNALINGTPSAASPVSILLAGGMSGVTCWAIIFPFDTLKSLIQKDIVTNTLRKEQGLEPYPARTRKLEITKRMYRGLSVSMTRTFLVNMVFFGTFEFSMKHFI